MTETRFTLEVQPKIPEQLARLEELANDLFYSWDRHVRGLFHGIDRQLWKTCGHSPKVFLRRISQKKLDDAVDDKIFMDEYARVLSNYDDYLDEGIHPAIDHLLDPEEDLIAYFCAEFGLHESFPIYSGGLGILAGDHCKAVSDLGIPFVAVGLLYRKGYFIQTIDAEGNQIARYKTTSFKDLPITPALDANGEELHIAVDMPERTIQLKVWKAKVGHISLYLLDSNLPDNSEHDRFITHQLYGGDKQTRIQQEIVLGIGGVRLLRALGLKPTVWHINEGHSAFQILERCREYVENGMKFDSALELVAAGTVYTTHTPVAAGHDIFENDLITTYFSDFATSLGLKIKELLNLGKPPSDEHSFNMTVLALHGSRFHNGVSRIHGGVASIMEGYVWPQIPHDENPISYVTNGVHVPTFLAREWTNLFDTRFRDWRKNLLNEEYWECIDEIPDHRVWSLQQSLKSEMLNDVFERVTQRHRRNGCSEALIHKAVRHIKQPENDILVLGFARRFATYKRATLLFSDPDRLKRLLNDPERPVLLIFAGKAHPNDMPGQHLIQVIHEFSQRPEFIGKIILLEGYDMALGRKLVTGVDVWLNTPEYPLEASGTSGEKAGINGVLNLSILDGWWGEGFNGENGWGIAPHGPQFDPAYRNHEEANDLMDILEKKVVPLYYDRDEQGYSSKWVQMSKNSMKSTIPHFNAQRMVMDYVKN
ncbi:MAG: alpha-glucan family phosphorylase, partial [Gammaproteobacteria bacterium]|nr:alpha-glucan family phosphorylase [Gammaproteobacteria bacterium]